jgi:hypothetical protein
MGREHGEARVARGAAGRGQQDVERHPARRITGKQDLHQIGQAFAWPGPGPQFAQCSLIDIDDQNARIVFLADLQAQETVAQPFIGQERHPIENDPPPHIVAKRQRRHGRILRPDGHREGKRGDDPTTTGSCLGFRLRHALLVPGVPT